MTPDELWQAYAATTGASGPWQAGAFAEEDPEVATELARLVRDGPKRATTSRFDDYAAEGEPLPAVGEHWVVTDGSGAAVCITRTTSVEVRRFGDVDEAFAWDEGEGDRSLASWRRAHLDYFARIGRPIDDETRVVLERFELVWPAGSADR